jgi:hypothetical protein
VALALGLLRGGPSPPEEGGVRPGTPAGRSPWYVLRACEQAQESADFAVLCPTRLPSVFGPPGGCNAPGPATVTPIRADGQTVGLDVAGPLHAGVLRAGSLYGRNEGWKLIRRGRLAGISGRLYYSLPGRGQPGYHADHLIFAFRRLDRDYLVSLHTSDERRPWTERDVKSLETVLDGLRPASGIEAPPRPGAEGARGSRLIGAIRLSLPSDVAVGGGRAWVIVAGAQQGSSDRRRPPGPRQANSGPFAFQRDPLLAGWKRLGSELGGRPREPHQCRVAEAPRSANQGRGLSRRSSDAPRGAVGPKLRGQEPLAHRSLGREART